MALKKKFVRCLCRLERAIFDSIGNNRVASDLFPALWSVIHYVAHRGSHRFSDPKDMFVDTLK